MELLEECNVRTALQVGLAAESLPDAERQSIAPGANRANGDIYSDIYGDIDVSINVTNHLRLNLRQEWFLIRVAQGERCLAQDIATHWQVALRTAKRDIAILRDSGRVRFEGSRRCGRYALIE